MDVSDVIARESVRDAYARYNHAGDRGRLDELADCFADDGVLEVENIFTATGRDEIVDALTTISRRVGRVDPPPPGTRHIVRHYVANLLFRAVTPTRIDTVAYYVVFQADAADHWGRYRDALVPGVEGWRFARRVVSVDGRRPGSTANLTR